jgi:hypothetical protein
MTNNLSGKGSGSFAGLMLYPQLLDTLNNDSDANKLHYPIRKLFNSRAEGINLFGNLAQNLSVSGDSSSGVMSHSSSVLNNFNEAVKEVDLNSPDTAFVQTERSMRHHPKLVPTLSHPNLSNGLNALASSLNTRTNNWNTAGVDFFFNYSRSNYVDLPLVQKLASNRTLIGPKAPGVKSNNPRLSGIDYDSDRVAYTTSKVSGNKVKYAVKFENAETASILQGDITTAHPALHASY